MALVSALLEIFQRPSIGDVILELMVFTTPIWVAVVIGVLVGWAWKPRWANLCASRDSFDSFVLSSTGINLQQVFSGFSSIPALKLQIPKCFSWISEETSSPLSPNSSSPLQENDRSRVVDENDLYHLYQLVEEKDDGPAWIQMMDRSATNMSYQAWRRDPETGPPQYRSRTVYEDATPEIVRDFFWDDEFRAKWDDMLVHAQTLEDHPSTGTMVVQWVRKFPFFCSDREYIIGRRIWKSGQTYYCVTKGVRNDVPRQSKPRRVDLYYSSWCIKPAASKRDGQMTACEVVLFHHEDMGIPWEIAKLGVRQGMWGAVKKIDSGLRAYQKHRATEAPLSRSALIAQINTKVTTDDLRSLEIRRTMSEAESSGSSDKPTGRNIPKLLVIGGAVALACSIDRGLLTKALIFGVARRFAGFGKRL
nr:START domain-containing proteins involved in steroidogenesis/phosphatidylcholine transfer [Ipomoea batatas]